MVLLGFICAATICLFSSSSFFCPRCFARYSLSVILVFAGERISFDAELMAEKKDAYAEYRKVKNDAEDLIIAKRNIESLYEASREEDQKRVPEKVH